MRGEGLLVGQSRRVQVRARVRQALAANLIQRVTELEIATQLIARGAQRRGSVPIVARGGSIPVDPSARDVAGADVVVGLREIVLQSLGREGDALALVGAIA